MVVGPNGCGKSNVVDAILWVLGEQSAKHLRGSGMEDVIFAGSDFQKPLGVAEVTLTFHNQDGSDSSRFRDYPEISVSRKLYRSGESVYMINKLPVRLMDVRELFMDTGIGSKSYAIIEQGKVGEIVSAKPIDRRYLIEEASGIVKFKTKRLSAERRLESTQQNLLRVEDLLQELQRQGEILREQTEKANQFLELKKQSEQTDRQLLALKWQRTRQQEKQSQGIKSRQEKRQSVLQKERDSRERRLEQLSRELGEHDAQLDDLREDVFQIEREIQENDNKRILERQNLQNYEEWICEQTREREALQNKAGTSGEEQIRIKEDAALLKKQYEQLQGEIDLLDRSREGEGTALQDLNGAMQDFQRRLLAVHTRLTDHGNQKSFLQDRVESARERGIRLEEQERSNAAHLGETRAKVSENEGKVDHLQKNLKKAGRSLSELQAAHSGHQLKMADQERRLQETQYRFQTMSSQLESLQTIQDRYEDLDESVKSFLTLLKEFPQEKKRLGIYGALAEFLDVDASHFAKIAPGLVDYLDLLVVEKSELLEEIEKFCRQHETGRLGFIALDRMKPFTSAEALPGIPLSDLMEFGDPLDGNAANSLARGFFSRIFLVEHEEAWRPPPPHETTIEWISPRGNFYTRQGIVKMGEPQQTSLGFLKRKNEIERLGRVAADLRKEVTHLTREKTILKDEEEKKSASIARKKNQQHELELELSQLRKELEFDQLEHRRAVQLGEQLEADQDQLRQEIQKIENDQEDVDAELTRFEKERQDLERNMKEHQESIKAQQESVEKISEKLLTTRVNLTETHEQLKTGEERAQRLQEESTECLKRIEVLTNSQQEITKKINRSREIVEDIDKHFDTFLQSRESLKSRLNEESQNHEQLREKRSHSSKALQELTQELDQLLTKIHQSSLQASEQRMRREQIEQEMLDAHNHSPEQVMEDLDLENLDERQVAGQLKKMRVKLNEMSQVNLAAPQEHAALRKRIQFLEQQSTDLQQAMDDLKQSIREINVESRQRFQETFDQVNHYFKETFTTLFEGGEARMILTDGDDVLEAGIQIIAQPPGKKLQNMNLLSGGEKALTAISLIFAIFLIKPSPFCLLDEVDAPLDDINVRRFNVMIQQLMEESQFIIITHNKKTMEIGHRLYGVTMEEPGVSKMVSVEFQDATGMTN